MGNQHCFDMDIKLFNADCRKVMEDMARAHGKVDLTVTSPPYDDLRKYNGTCRWDFSVFTEVCDLLHEVTADGGVVVWVVGDSCHDGSESGTSFRQALRFMQAGFKLHDTMIFVKNSSTFPAKHKGNRYTQVFEYMFVLAKGRMHPVTLLADKRNAWAGHSSWDRTIPTVPEFSPRTNVWKYSVGFNGKRFGRHPAVFPLQLATDHIRSWSMPGHVVFDPFLGSGTTMEACVNVGGRDFIGCEIDPEYFGIIQRRHDHLLKDKDI